MSELGDKTCARCGATVPYVWGEGECEACHKLGIDETRMLREMYQRPPEEPKKGVHVKRGGEWIDADFYEVGDEILIGGHTSAVIKMVGTGEDGVASADVGIAILESTSCPPGCRTVTHRVNDAFCPVCRKKMDDLFPNRFGRKADCP